MYTLVHKLTLLPQLCYRWRKGSMLLYGNLVDFNWNFRANRKYPRQYNSMFFQSHCLTCYFNLLSALISRTQQVGLGFKKCRNLRNIFKVWRFGGTYLKNIPFLKHKHTTSYLTLDCFRSIFFANQTHLKKSTYECKFPVSLLRAKKEISPATSLQQ